MIIFCNSISTNDNLRPLEPWLRLASECASHPRRDLQHPACKTGYHPYLFDYIFPIAAVTRPRFSPARSVRLKGPGVRLPPFKSGFQPVNLRGMDGDGWMFRQLRRPWKKIPHESLQETHRMPQCRMPVSNFF